MIDLLPIALLCLLFWFARPVRPLTGFYDDGLSLRAALPLRGALALMVVFHHLAQRTQAGVLMRPYTDLGYMPVALFFFLSGYGVTGKYLASPDYRQGFLRRRLHALLGPLLPALAVYAALQAAVNPFSSAWDFYNGVIGDMNAWFLVNLILFYAEFALAMRLARRPAGMLAFMAVCWAGYVAGCVAVGYGDWWYKSSHAFLLGMAWAIWGKRWTARIRRRARLYWPLLAACWALCALIHQNIWPMGRYLPLKAFIPSAAAATLFVCGVVLLTMKLRLGNPLLDCLGRISYEIYILHGILLICLRRGRLSVENDAAYALLVLGGTIALASAWHWGRSRITDWRRTRHGR